MTARPPQVAAATATALLLCALAALPGCPGSGGDDPPGATSTAAAPAEALADADADADTDADADADAGAADAGVADAAAGADAAASGALLGTSEGCPGDMVLVAGGYCPEAGQACLKHHEEFEHDQDRKKSKRDKGEEVGSSTVSERCMEYKQPSRCLSKERRPMRYCVDRYEWPNKRGELPALLISWADAKKTCESVGKRLCTEDEFNFACEGEEMLPYTYGYARDPSKCSIDKPYRKRQRRLFKYERCMRDPRCKAELARLDQRLPVGSLPQCVSPFGAYDMNGNMNEWVTRPGKKYPNRSGLKGGWWGPVRGRCRPTVGFHKEDDYGYEEGFRCCKDAEAP